jgi:hypothetical protein
MLSGRFRNSNRIYRIKQLKEDAGMVSYGINSGLHADNPR